uniref:Tail protein n=1 Tax=Pseudomonas phage RVTF4 TaxID=3236931 RepID=A0AB39CD14_9VIRU
MINQIFLQQLMSDMLQVGTATQTAIKLLSKRINDHILAKGNPHQMGPADIGLDRVANYAPATVSEAVKGINNTTLMTPKRTTNWAEENVYGPIGQAFKDAAARLP